MRILQYIYSNYYNIRQQASDGHQLDHLLKQSITVIFLKNDNSLYSVKFSKTLFFRKNDKNKLQS
ncbi:hypothetical protein ES703_74573 [subsurface metagenome]